MKVEFWLVVETTDHLIHPSSLPTSIDASAYSFIHSHIDLLFFSLIHTHQTFTEHLHKQALCHTVWW
jgi:hypothetical protein